MKMVWQSPSSTLFDTEETLVDWDVDSVVDDDWVDNLGPDDPQSPSESPVDLTIDPDFTRLSQQIELDFGINSDVGSIESADWTHDPEFTRPIESDEDDALSDGTDDDTESLVDLTIDPMFTQLCKKIEATWGDGIAIDWFDPPHLTHSELVEWEEWDEWYDEKIKPQLEKQTQPFCPSKSFDEDFLTYLKELIAYTLSLLKDIDESVHRACELRLDGCCVDVQAGRFKFSFGRAPVRFSDKTKPQDSVCVSLPERFDLKQYHSDSTWSFIVDKFGRFTVKTFPPKEASEVVCLLHSLLTSLP